VPELEPVPELLDVLDVPVDDVELVEPLEVDEPHEVPLDDELDDPLLELESLLEAPESSEFRPQ
jgi:hypothetical protein